MTRGAGSKSKRSMPEVYNEELAIEF